MPVGLPGTEICVTTGVAAVVIFAMWLMPGSATQMLPSGPLVIRAGDAPPARVTWVLTPPGVTRQTSFFEVPLTHRLPSAPVAIRVGPVPAVSVAISVNTCVCGSSCTTVLLEFETKYRSPLGPAVMPRGLVPSIAGMANELNVGPAVVRPILFVADSVNHTAPSEPVVIPTGLFFVPGIVARVTAPVLLMWPSLLLPALTNHTLPSAPTVRSPGWLLVPGILKSEIVCVAAPAGPAEATAATASNTIDASALPACRRCDSVLPSCMCSTRPIAPRMSTSSVRPTAVGQPPANEPLTDAVARPCRSC